MRKLKRLPLSDPDLYMKEFIKTLKLPVSLDVVMRFLGKVRGANSEDYAFYFIKELKNYGITVTTEFRFPMTVCEKLKGVSNDKKTIKLLLEAGNAEMQLILKARLEAAEKVVEVSKDACAALKTLPVDCLGHVENSEIYGHYLRDELIHYMGKASADYEKTKAGAGSAARNLQAEKFKPAVTSLKPLTADRADGEETSRRVDVGSEQDSGFTSPATPQACAKCIDELVGDVTTICNGADEHNWKDCFLAIIDAVENGEPELTDETILPTCWACEGMGGECDVCAGTGSAARKDEDVNT